jgi:simple sugar transport system ATP-binding protein
MRVELRNISLRFGAVQPLRDVSLEINSGEVVCLLGDNGAGKSSLIRVLSGVHAPAAGEYVIDGDVVHFDSPRAAFARGIATVHQDLGLIPLMPVWRNFVLGAEPMRGRGLFRRIDAAAARSITTSAIGDLGIVLRDADVPVAKLSGGERQSVAIARAVHRGARMLILDEPTAALGVKQAHIVLRNIDAARARGIAVLFVTHNPQHAYEAGDRFVVLQQGRVVASLSRAETSTLKLSEWMSDRVAE